MSRNLDPFRNQARAQLDSALSVLEDLLAAAPNIVTPVFPRLHKALGSLIKYKQDELKITTGPSEFTTMARQFDVIQHVGHCLDILELAALQRTPGRPTNADLLGLDVLIESCYEPVGNVKNKFPLSFQPDEIVAVFLQDTYLARPFAPTPYITLPNFTQRTRSGTGKPWSWMGIGHEVGHHVYHQLLGLRDEVKIAIQVALQKQNSPPAQVRLWLAYAEEVFADCYAILTLGRAFLYTHQPIFLYAGSSEAAKAAPQEDDYIRQTLLERGDASHPTPALRSRLGISAYQQLVGSNPLPEPLQNWLNNVIDTFTDPYDDVLSPRGDQPGQPQPDIFNPDPAKKLPQNETHAAMQFVVDTILGCDFVSLGNKCLKDLVSFAQDEQTRDGAGGFGKPQDRINVPAQVIALVEA